MSLREHYFSDKVVPKVNVKMITARNNRGQGMVEYGLILGLIAIVAIASISTFGQNMYSMFMGDGAIVDNVTGYIQNN